jgi:hypothetical protein
VKEGKNIRMMRRFHLFIINNKHNTNKINIKIIDMMFVLMKERTEIIIEKKIIIVPTILNKSKKKEVKAMIKEIWKIGSKNSIKVEI